MSTRSAHCCAYKPSPIYSLSAHLCSCPLPSSLALAHRPACPPMHATRTPAQMPRKRPHTPATRPPSTDHLGLQRLTKDLAPFGLSQSCSMLCVPHHLPPSSQTHSLFFFALQIIEVLDDRLGKLHGKEKDTRHVVFAHSLLPTKFPEHLHALHAWHTSTPPLPICPHVACVFGTPTHVSCVRPHGTQLCP